MKRISRTLAAVAVAFSLPCLSRTAVEAQRRHPNIVVIVSDDMGYADIGDHGSKDIPTPNIDALARGGIRFTDAYVSGPYCSPTRAGLLTGRYPQRFGHEFNPESAPSHSEIGLPPGEKTMADRLRAAGYRTALVGKWHLGRGDKFHPLERGFDEFFGFLGGAHSYIATNAEGANPLLDGRKIVAETTYLTDAFADRAVVFIKRQKSRPFFLYLAFNAVHTPMHATEKYLARFPHIADQQRRTYAAMLSAMDDGIGRTLAALREAGLEEDTLIVFFNDNGGPTMAGTTINGSSNAPLRGSKRQTWEGGIRVAFIVRWKGRLAEGKTDSRPVIQLDVLPTALAAAGVVAQPQWKFDGVNLLPFLTGKRSGAPHEALFWRLGENIAIRKGEWKLVKTSERPLQAVDPAVYNELSGAELYNLSDDISERKNLAAAHPGKVRELAADWQRWNRELAKPLWAPTSR
ncbi:MAG: sulfatase [Acidobacteria bacterium]|nr:sulfatase [Acidobacteriota bacterium]